MSRLELNGFFSLIVNGNLVSVGIVELVIFEEEHAAECQACEENVEIQISKSKTKKDYSKNSPSTNFISRFVSYETKSNQSRAPPSN